MVASVFGNIAKMTIASVASSGLGAITLGSAVSGYVSFATAGLVDGQTFSYTAVRASDGAKEVGTSVYTASGTTMTRVLTLSTTGSLLTLTSADTVEMVQRAEDVAPVPVSGSWTPVLTFGAGGVTGITYSAQLGTYTKIGRLVFCSFNVTLTNKGSSTGNASITGLPFAANTTTNMFQMIPLSYGTAPVGWVGFIAQMAGVASTAFGFFTTANAAITNASFANGSQIIGTFIYQTD